MLMAVVYANQTLLGIVTLEDILEAIVGEFMTRTMMEDYDEFSLRLVERDSALPVEWALGGGPIVNRRMTVALPDHHLLIGSDRTYRFSKEAKLHYVRLAADCLFETAAEVFGPRAIAVVLSGYGKDGAGGARAIKNEGGPVFQNWTSSERTEMPQAAIDGGLLILFYPHNGWRTHGAPSCGQASPPTWPSPIPFPTDIYPPVSRFQARWELRGAGIIPAATGGFGHCGYADA